MASLTSFTQQLKSRFIFTSILLGCLFIGLLAFFYSRESAFHQFSHQTLPELQQQISEHHYLVEGERLLAQILIAKTPQNFHSLLSSYQATLTRLIKNGSQHKALAMTLLSKVQTFSEPVALLSVNAEKYEQFKQSAIVQLQLITSDLKNNIALETLTSQPTAKLNATLFSQALLLLNNLTIATDVENFIAFNNEFNQRVGELLETTSDKSSTINSPIHSLLIELNNLLWVDQRIMAKWRGNLRVSQEFIAVVAAQHKLLLSLKGQLTITDVAEETLWPKALLPMLPLQVRASDKAYYITLLLISIATAITLITFLIQLFSLIKHHQQHLILVATQRVKGGEESPIISTEQEQLLDLIEQLSQPEHGEADYQYLQQQFKLLSQHQQTVLWTTQKPASSNHLFIEILGISPQQRWYHAFTRTVACQILSAARSTKVNGGVLQLNVKDKQGRLLLITVEYNEQYWHGTLVVQAQKVKLESALVDLNQKVSQQTESEKLQRFENKRKLCKMLVRTLLQSQSASLGAGGASRKVYRQVVLIIEWLKQLQLMTALSDKNQIMQLSDINLVEELSGLIANISVGINHEGNTLEYRIDRHVIAPCKLNIQLLHQALYHFCGSLMQDLAKANLHIALSMADKNSGQQFLNFSFTVTQQHNTVQVPAFISNLIELDDKKLANQTLLTQYFYLLLKVTHCEQLQVKEVDNGYNVSFVMPITTLVSNINSDEIVEFNQRNILLISNKAWVTNILEKRLKKQGAILSTIANIKYLKSRLTAKKIAQNKLALIIISSDIFTHDFEKINKQVAALPLKLRPKIFVCQPVFNQPFHQKGMFAHTHNFLNSHHFSEALKQLIKSDQPSNLLLPAELFKPYRFSPSQVELLLAVSDPSQHEVLLRLLHWMGLQVHVVCNERDFLEQWQSGRYFILLNDLDVSPLQPLNVGKTVSRTVYSFSSTKIQQWRDGITEKHSSWKLVLLSNVLDLSSLISAFRPWLKEAPLVNKVITKSQNNVTKSTAIAKPIKHKGNDTSLAFDQVKYAENQGSPELAALMLSDYMSSLDKGISQLMIITKEKDCIKARPLLHAIIKTAKILAANDLLSVCEQLMLLVVAKDVNNFATSMNNIQLKYQQLAEYAEAI
ncbi:MAG: hypothetical protein ACPG46_02700 [Thalassotalea sp.]